MSSHYVPHTKIPTLVFATSVQASRHVALMIESLIRQNNSAGRPTVLGLPTGSTPVGLYRELIRLHKENGLDFARVVTMPRWFCPSARDRPDQIVSKPRLEYCVRSLGFLWRDTRQSTSCFRRKMVTNSSWQTRS